eukprot:TRINITY_DN16788_c0_g1_i1.p1 TRINITY_DN16788_c0_g1~~TRINITY_DN16788_c0_g1_i1.p1  ORF type:complete len:400 (-),score=113.92 TRINITY_DN16788_c0_g1_i1:83-1282(-)
MAFGVFSGRMMALGASLQVCRAMAGAIPGEKRLVSEEPRIEMRTNFLTSEEVTALRSLAEDLGLEQLDSVKGVVNGGDEYVVLNASAVDEDIDRDLNDDEAAIEAATTGPGWDVAAELEKAAAAWAKVDASSARPTIITRWDSWSPSSALNRSGTLHLDARRNRFRQHSVLAFLSGSGKKDDGFVVFPCVETDEMTAEEAAKRSKLCSRAYRHLKAAHDKVMRTRDEGLLLPDDKVYEFFEAHPELAALAPEDVEGRRPIDWQWGPEKDEVGNSTPGARPVEPLHWIVEQMCRGEAEGLRIAPTAGSAILFEAARRTKSTRSGQQGELEANWRLWHAGCSPRRGKRWTAQVFLEAAPRQMSSSSPPEEAATCSAAAGGGSAAGRCDSGQERGEASAAAL